LITGASGFIGSCLVNEAIERGYRVYAGVRAHSSRAYLDHPAINFIELDLDDPVAVDKTLKNFKNIPDFVIHAAGITKALHRDEYRKINFERTRDLVRALIHYGLVPDKFLYISSLSSFGPGGKDAPITIYQERQPLSEYGRSKLQAERFLYGLQDFPSVIINPTAVYGPRDKGFLLVMKCIQKHLDLRIAGAGGQLSFMHVDDLCQAIFLCMESAPLRQQFLVSDLATYTGKDFNDIVRSVLQKKTISLTLPAWVAKGAAWAAEMAGRMSDKPVLLNRDRFPEFAAANWSVDCSDIVKLGFRPRHDLEQGLGQTIRWYQKEGWI